MQTSVALCVTNLATPSERPLIMNDPHDHATYSQTKSINLLQYRPPSTPSCESHLRSYINYGIANCGYPTHPCRYKCQPLWNSHRSMHASLKQQPREFCQIYYVGKRRGIITGSSLVHLPILHKAVYLPKHTHTLNNILRLTVVPLDVWRLLVCLNFSCNGCYPIMLIWRYTLSWHA